MQYILAHDLGTSGNKATLYALDGTLKGSVVCEYPTYYPNSGWVEQDADDWWKAVCDSTKQLLEKTDISASAVACVCFSAQMMGCLLIDRNNVPLRRMITWADTRSSVQEKYLLEHITMEQVYKITGHRLSASNSGVKLLWVRDNEPELFKRAGKMLHAKEYIILKLTGEIVTDFSDAGGTNLLDINNRDWSQDLLSVFDIPRDILPDIYPSTHIAGKVSAEAARHCGLLEGTPVVTGGGDGSCATIGAGAVKVGKVYNVIGSSSWFSSATEAPVFDPLMRIFNWIHMDERMYSPCGAMQAAGFSYAWFRNSLCKEELDAGSAAGVSAYKLIDELASAVKPGAGGLLFLPYLLGERSPLWDHDARGAFVGLGISTSKGEMARAVLEGVGFNLKAILDIFNEDSPVENVTMIGAGVKGDVWLQILADIWQRPLLVPRYLEEATSMGAAICGGVGVGIYDDFSVAEEMNMPVRCIEPDAGNAGVYDELYKVFTKAYTQLKPIYRSLAEV